MNKKYLFTIRSLTGGGAERVVSVFSSFLVNKGYDVSIIAYEKNKNDYRINEKVKIYYMPKAPNNILGKIKRIPDMRKLIKKIAPDVIIPFVGTVLFVSYLAALPEKTPIIRTIRNSPWDEPGNFIEKIMRKYINKKAKAIMVQNEEQIEFFSENLREKIKVIPNPIDENFINIKKEEYSMNIKNIISVGRLNIQKNQELLIRGFDKVLKENPDIKLYIYGEGNQKEKLENLIKELKITKNCFLMGRDNNIIDKLTQADLFVMTSDFEGMPNALMEAMALGLPCISSDCKTGPNTLIKQKENGILFKCGDEEDLIDSIKWCISQGKNLEKIGKNARIHMLNNYTVNESGKKLEEFLEGI